MASPITAAGAYANIARLTANATRGVLSPSGDAQPTGNSFSAVLKQALGEVQQLGHKSDVASRDMVNGKSNMVDVVTAVAETQVAIDAVVAVRDKVINAYQQILQMPI